MNLAGKRSGAQNLPAAVPGQFHYEPLIGDDDAHTKTADTDKPSGNSYEGSGSNYLSNEIFYRTAVRRNAARPNLASGHFHLPGFLTPTARNPEATQRQRLIQGVENAVERFLQHTFRLTAADLSFPDTFVNATSAPLTLTVSNGTSETLKISALEASAPFSVQSPTPLPTAQSPITLNARASVTLSLAFTPTAVGSVTGNNLVWRRFIFPAVTTGKVRVVVNAAVDGVARIVEAEAWGRDAP